MLSSIKRHPGKLVLLLILAAVAGWLLWHYRASYDAKRWIDYGNELPVAILVLTFLILPLLGVPITIFLVLAGMRFGFVNGALLSTACIFFHNAVAYKVTHSTFRRPLRLWLERKGRALPEFRADRQTLYTIIFAAVSGPPYTLKLYLLPLSDVSLRTCLLAAATTYSVFGLIAVGAGSAAMEIKPAWIAAIVAVAIAFTLLIRWAMKKLTARLAEKPPA